MANIKGIIVEIGGDTTGLQKALSKVNSNISSLSKELKGVNSLLKLDPKNTELLSQKQEVLKENIEETSKKLEELKKAQTLADEKMLSGGEISQKNYRNLQREIINTENKLKNLQAEASKWTTIGRNIEEFGNKLTNISNKIDKVGTTLTTRLTLPIATIAAGLVKTSMDFEIAFTGVEKTVDGTATQLANLKRGIKEMAEEIPSSTTEIAAVAEAAGQLGIKTDDILAFTKVMINLGNSTNLSAEEAASALAKFANVTKMSADDYEKLGSTIVDLGNNFATTEADIVNMATNLASTGELTGLTQAQILALATAMSSVGIEAEAGGTAMSKLLKKIQVAVETGSDDLKDFAKVAGMSAKDFKKAFQEDAVNGLTAFITGLNDTERNGKSAIAILNDMDIKEVRLSNTILSLANASGLMSDAVETAGKAWNENVALTNEANKRYQTLESRMQKTKNKILNVATSTGDKLTPTFNQLLDKVDGVIDKFGDLNEEELKNIIKTAGLVAAIGPATKIVSTLGKTIGTGTKAIGTFSQAIGLMGKTSTEAFKNASAGTQILAKELTFLTTPTGLATIAVTALAGALVYLSLKETDAQKKSKELAQEVENQKKSLEEYETSVNETMNTELSHINQVSRLKDELHTLVDENGKVKEGYKNRVDFILGELNKALGTELGLNGDIIKNYKDLQKEIDNTIAKKKAEIIIKSGEEKYTKAIEEEAEATENFKKAYDDLGMSIEEAKTKLQDMQYTAALNAEDNGTNYWDSKEIRRLKRLIKTYEEAEGTVKECTENKKKYESDYALWQEGKYEEISNTVKNTTKDWTDTSIQEIKDAIGQEKNELVKYKDLYERTGNEIYLQQQQQSQQNLDNLATELAKRTSTLEELGQDEIDAWKALADNSSGAYEKALSQVDVVTAQKVQDATGIIIKDTGLTNATANKANDATVGFKNKLQLGGKTQEEIDVIATNLNNDSSVGNAATNLGEDINTNFNNKLDGWTWGWDLVKNIYNGLTSINSKRLISEGASTVGSIIKSFLGFSLPEKGPLSTFDKSMPDMIELMKEGIDNNKLKVINAAERLAQELNDALNTDIKRPDIQDFGSFQGNINHKITDKTKNIFTTPQIIFNVQELDKEKLDQCFDYINRKFGSRY